MKKIAHISLFWQHPLGIVNKIESLAKTCKENGILIDFILITVEKEALKELKYLKVFTIKDTGNIFYKRKKQVEILNQIAGDYDKIVMRYPLFDPVILLLLKNKKKYIFEHHTKEIEELKLQKDKRYLFELFFGKWLNLFGGIIGVTKEIEAYEIKRAQYKGFHYFMPNSIDINDEEIKGQVYASAKVNIVMTANFSSWHGLDLILDEIKNDLLYQDKYVFHIIGSVEAKDTDLYKKNEHIKFYGLKTKEEIIELYKKMDVGLGAFNVGIKGLNETTTLKVREYFNNGLLVFIGDRDLAFPNEFPFLLQGEKFSLKTLFNFLNLHKGTAKDKIKVDASQYIDSRIILSELYNEISKI